MRSAGETEELASEYPAASIQSTRSPPDDRANVVRPVPTVRACQGGGTPPNDLLRGSSIGERPLPGEKPLRIDQGLGLEARALRRKPDFELGAPRCRSLPGLRQALRQREGDERIERSPAQQLPEPKGDPWQVRGHAPGLQTRRLERSSISIPRLGYGRAHRDA